MRVTLALERYDRHLPFFLKEVAVPDDIELEPLEVGMFPPRRDGVDRHGRMIHRGEFEAAELSLSSYIVARSRGAPLTAIPTFPRRLFSQNHFFVREDSPLERLSDLAGKRVVLHAFQVTMSVLAKGDLADYGLDWRDVSWLTLHDEEVPGQTPAWERLPPGTDQVALVLGRGADAFVSPHPPLEAMSGRHGVRRLLRDPQAECERRHAALGYAPVMHLIALREDVAAARPDLPLLLMRLWDEARALAEDYYTDPGYALSMFARFDFERQQATLGRDVWRSGLAANRANLERFMGYMVDQGIIPRPLPTELLFHASTHGT